MKKITSINNEFIKELNKLHEKKERDKRQQFIIEGFHLIQEAKRYLDLVLIVDEKDEVAGIENILVTKEIITKLSFTKTPQNIIGICHYFDENQLTGERFLILDNVQDPGNLGTLVRSALGFNIDQVIMSIDSVDMYNDKFIRATQGAVFKMRMIKRDLIEAILDLKERNVLIIGTSLKASIDLDSLSSINKYALVLGNEANGVSDDILKLVDTSVKIRTNSLLESLNVGVAGGIILYYLDKKQE
ncbi:MAG: RNA methyltransferase [Bacilli bacterium]|nr:RNA methyltransferase [Bacilli bacterium]